MRNVSYQEMDRVDQHYCNGHHVSSVVEVPRYFAWKSFWARLSGGVLLVLFSPLILLLMLLVRLTSKGPALFKQVRVGKDDKEFHVLKIRTMYQDAEKESGAVLCKPGDARITPIGKLLRFLHLDELPQLVNVMRGEMCLIGPRPERPEIIQDHKLRDRVPGFSERTKVLPGVTGLAQINLPPDQTPECVIPKVQLDLEYIENAGIGLDARILLCTFLRMLGIRHGRAVHLLSLNRKVVFREIPNPKKPRRRRMFGLQSLRGKRAAAPQPVLASVHSNGSAHYESVENKLLVHEDLDQNEFGLPESDEQIKLPRRVPR